MLPKRFNLVSSNLFKINHLSQIKNFDETSRSQDDGSDNNSTFAELSDSLDLINLKSEINEIINSQDLNQPQTDI